MIYVWEKKKTNQPPFVLACDFGELCLMLGSHMAGQPLSSAGGDGIEGTLLLAGTETQWPHRSILSPRIPPEKLFPLTLPHPAFGGLWLLLCASAGRDLSLWSIFGCSEKDSQPCPLWAGCGSLFLQNPAEFRFLFFFPHLPSPFGNFRPAVRPNFTHSFSTKTLFCPRKCSNLSFYHDFFFPCDVEVYVSLKNPRPCFWESLEEALQRAGQQHGLSHLQQKGFFSCP